MNLLPNDNLAGFLRKRLFAEPRFVFVDRKDEDQTIPNSEQEPTDLEINEQGSLEHEQQEETKKALQGVGWETRDQIWEVDQDGYFGMGGSRSPEKISENPAENWEDLLREKTDYDSAIQGIEMSAADFEDSLGYKLLGGENGLPIKTFSGVFGKKVSEKYQALCEIREGLQYQENSSHAMERYIQHYRDEIAEEKAEYLRNLEQERNALLEKIAQKLETEKEELEQEVQSFKNICVEPEALKIELAKERYLDDEQKTGLFDYIEKTTNLTELSAKIREGNFADSDVAEMSEQIKAMRHLAEERRQNVEDLKDLHENDEAKAEIVAELLKGVQTILAEYREERSKNLDPSKAPTNEEEKKIVKLFIHCEERLEQNEPKINIREIASIEDVLGKMSQPLKVLRENRATLEIEIPEDKTSQEMKKQLNDEIAQLLDAPIPFNQEAREYDKKNKAELSMFQAELSDANFKHFALNLGSLDENGDLTEDVEILRKKWLVDKQRKLQEFKEKQQKIRVAPVENLNNLTAKAEVQKYLQQIKTAENPVEVVDQLAQKQHLKIVNEAAFQKKYRETGITNSDLVIEQTKYEPELPDYSENDWTIYLDEKYYNKIKNNEGNSERFRARIAHELAHREFEVEVGNLLEKGGIYENAEWKRFKQQFSQIIQGKTVGGDAEGYANNRNILNEMYALSRENAVQEIENNEPLKNLIDDFTAEISPILDKKEKKIFGSMAETGGDNPAPEQSEVSPEKTDGEAQSGENIQNKGQEQGEYSEKHQKEINGLRQNLQSLKMALEGFGVKLDTEEEDKAKADSEQNGDVSKKKKEEDFTLDISKAGSGAEEKLNKIVEEYKNVAGQIENKEFLDNQNEVQKANNVIGHYLKGLNETEKYISSLEQGSGDYFSNLWKNTRFLSADDVFHLVTESWEFIQRRRDRNSQDARAAVGQKLFEGVPCLDLLSGEYLAKRESLEAEEVNNYKSNLDNMSYDNIFLLLFHPKNKDYLNATIQTLCEQGYMRWDDPRVWKALGKYTFVKIPNEKKAQDDIEYRNTWLRKIVGDIWDVDTWDGWQKANSSGLMSSLSDLDDSVNTLHALGGGAVAAKLDELIEPYRKNIDHFGDENSDVALIQNHQYYKLLDYAFERGKLKMEQKFYYLIEGARYRILTVEDFRRIQSTRFGILPILDFFYAHNNSYNDIVKLSDKIHENGGYPDGVHKLLFQSVLHDGSVRPRISKKLSSESPKDIDHDDWQAIMAAVDVNQVDLLLSRPAGGGQRITTESILTGMTSFSTFAKAQAPLMDDPNYKYDNLINSINSFVVYDGILMDRYKNPDDYATLSKEKRNLDYMGAGYKTKDYQESMYKFITRIFEKYDPQGGKPYADRLFVDTEDMNATQKKAVREGQNGSDSAIDDFGNKIRQIASTKRGREIIKEALQEVSGGMASYLGENVDFSMQAKWAT